MSKSLPQRLYCAEQVKQGEQEVARQMQLPMFDLMARAGQALFDHVQEQWPNLKTMLVCCGTGNNGGDGYVLAYLAKQAGIDVQLWQLGQASALKGDAAIARDLWLSEGGDIDMPRQQIPEQVELVVDAMLGTGIKGKVRLQAAELIRSINAADRFVLSVDVPSGIDCDLGVASGEVVSATTTLTFIAVKQGLLTGVAKAVVGRLYYASLDVQDEFEQLMTPSCWRMSDSDVASLLGPRYALAHKGSNGRVVCIGGDYDMAGAIALSSQGCLRTGAGLVAAMTRTDHIAPLITRTPELMVLGCERASEGHVQQRLAWADVVVAGPGLGMESWGRSFYQLLTQPDIIDRLNLVFDADALNLLAQEPSYNDKRVLTPHPGEAARLLHCSVPDIESDRFLAVSKIQKKYGGVVVLKGPGSLIFDGENYALVQEGNPGMASGGMGDVLSGIIGGLLAQQLTLFDAARLGTWIHSRAGDLASQNGERGMLASDLFPYIRQLINEQKIEDANI